ncbi:tetratricopeptide repeat protein [Streptomyces sp. NPDC048342]|uniref:tetratricopeptide repeat protein n=1 Tax=unclassified Streptomyces TaxID=2593676 RepID=UPI00343F0723
MDRAGRKKLLEQAREAVRAMRSHNAEAAKRMQQLYPEVRQVADSGDPEFQELIGGIALEYMKEYEAARWYFGQAAKAGNVAALRGLGYMLLRGLGGNKDPEKAVELFQVAAAEGDGAAQYNLGAMYLRGDVVPKSKDKALQYLEAASAAGEGTASWQLGDIKLAERDYNAARHYMELSADQGAYVGLKELAPMCRDGVGGDIDLVRALGCFLKLLDIGDGDGMHEAHQLADRMTDEEIREAASWANHAAEGESLIRRARH